MFDEKGILEHLRALNESLKDWERYQSIPLEELHTDRDKRNMVLHALLIRYWRLDIDAIYEIVQQDLGVLKEFESAVKRLLQDVG